MSSGALSLYSLAVFQCAKASLSELQEKLNAQKNLLKGCNREINEAQAERSRLAKDISNTQLEIQELELKVNKCNRDTNDAAKLVICRVALFLL